MLLQGYASSCSAGLTAGMLEPMQDASGAVLVITLRPLYNQLRHHDWQAPRPSSMKMTGFHAMQRCEHAGLVENIFGPLNNKHGESSIKIRSNSFAQLSSSHLKQFLCAPSRSSVQKLSNCWKSVMYIALHPFISLLAVNLLPSVALVRSAQTPSNASANAEGISPLFAVVPPVLTGDTDAVVAITQGLSLYGLAIDTKNFTALAGAFTSDIVANVPPLPITGLAKYESFLAADLAPLKTQHITSNVFAYNIAGGTAESVSYQQAVHIGSGKLLGKIVTFYERFDDVWRRDQVDGSWKISERTLSIFVRDSILHNSARCRKHVFSFLCLAIAGKRTKMREPFFESLFECSSQI